MYTIFYYLTLCLSALFVMTVMGFSKAYTSYKLGDIAIKNKGKVSLNPKKHFEIIGFVLIAFFGYGWTAPVDTSSLYYKNRKRDTILVNVVPLIVAIILAIILYLVALLVIKIQFDLSMISMFFMMTCSLLIQFAIFNLLPIYPLFGQKLFQAILPTNKSLVLTQYEKIIQLLIIFLLLMGYLQKVLGFISNIVLKLIANTVTTLIGIL